MGSILKMRLVASVLALCILAICLYFWMNRASVVHSETQLIGEVIKTRYCTAPGHCYASQFVNGEYKHFYGYHPNCSGSKKTRGLEHQLKRVWSDDDITYDYIFAPIEDISKCST